MRKRIIPILLVIAVLGGGGYWAWTTYGPAAQAAASELGGSGTIEADQIAVTSQVSGRITVAPAQEGVSVKKGDVLYRLDDSLLKLSVAQAMSGVAAAKANLRHVLKKSTDSNRAEKAAAKAQYEQALVAQRMAKVQLGYAKITSPIDGVLSNLAVRAGENANPGSTLAIVSDIANLYVTIYVPENRIGEVKIGQPGTVSTDSTKQYAATVTYVAPQAEFTPASIETKDQRVKLVYQVKLRVTDADSALKPGMPADVVLK
jgi:HlyD family secretion protein